MKITSKKINDILYDITLDLSLQTYEKEWKQKIKTYANQVKIPGFRKSNTTIIEQKYGESIFKEMIEKTIQKELWDYIQKQGWQLQEAPYIDFLPLKAEKKPQNKEVALQGKLLIIPTIEIDLKALSLTKYNFKEEREKIETAYVEEMRTYLGVPKAKAKAEEGDIVEGVWAVNGKPLQKGAMTFPVNEQTKSLLYGLVGAEKGQDLTAEVRLVLESQLLKEILQKESIDKGDIQLLTFHVKAVKGEQKATLGEAFYRRAFPKLEKPTKENFQAEVKKRVSKNIENNLKAIEEEEVRKQILAKLSFEGKVNGEDKRWASFVHYISQKEKITISEQEMFMAYTTTFLQEFVKAYGRAATEKEMKAFWQQPKRDRAFDAMCHFQVMEKKVLAHIQSQVKPKEVALTAKKYTALIKAANASK